MNASREWVYHDPRWWIDQIAIACAPDHSEPKFRWPVDEYFVGLKDRLAGTLRYLSAHPNLNPYEVRKSLFFAKALKKWRLPMDRHSASERADRAQDGFVVRNEAADADVFVPKHIECMRRVLQRWLPEIGTEMIHGRFGPGAVAEGWMHPQRFCRLWEWCQLGADWETATYGHADAEAGTCRLCAVPKDWDKDRLITVEPAFLSFVEQRVRRILLESIHAGPLRGTAMDLGYTDGQAIQRRLALEASRTGLDATIDLSDASDGVSWAAVQAVFPEWVLNLLWGARSFHCVRKFRNGGGFSSRLNMYAGMGNATTFVVETLFFSAYAVAVQKAHGASRPWVSTFGDDIIVSSDACEWLLEEGSQPFFQINRSKSFLGHDALRESCGIFAHSGRDVTVPKIDGYAETYQGLCGVADLHRRLVSSGDEFQLVLASRIARVGVIENWPFMVDGHPSISDWSAEFSALPRTRYNRQYQRREALVKDLRCESVRYPCSDAWVTPDGCEPTEPSELDRRRIRTRELKPPADVWYQANRLGCLQTDPIEIRREADLKRVFRASTVSFPTGRVDVRERWAHCLPSGEDPQVRSKFERTFDDEGSVWDKVLRDTHFDLALMRDLRRVASPLT